MGHEMTGRIVKMGDERKTDSAGQPLKEGDSIVWAYARCGHCFYCTVAHQPTLCPNSRKYGRGPSNVYPYLTGGFAEYIYVYPGAPVVKVPPGLNPQVVSAATCAFRTVVHGFEKLGGVSYRDSVAILGSGPVGLWALAVCAVSGVPLTIMLGAPRHRLELAKRWGAHHVIDITEEDWNQRKQTVLGLTDGRGPDVVIQCAPSAEAFKQGLELVRPGGKYLVIGGGEPGSVTLQPNVMTKYLTIYGVLSGDVNHYYNALQFLKNNQNRLPLDSIITNTYPLSRINEALQAMDDLKEMKPGIVP